MKDIFFEKEYGRLYEKIENGTIKEFKLENEYGKITNLVIQREIPIKIDGKKYYDLITPYGYGGPIIEFSNDKIKLLENYEKEFKKFCNENDIISEFVRFHPIIKNYEDFKELYNAQYMRKTLATNLEKFENPFESEFSKSCKKKIRQILNIGVEYRIIEKPENLEEFKRIYNLNLKRKEASKYYFFDNEYFSNILKNYKENIILVEAIFEKKVIAAGLYFLYNNIIHVHLSGTDTKYLDLSPAYILKYATVIWGKQKGFKLIHYGGGLSNSEEDSLYQFKKKFAQNTNFDFYIGKKIWNLDIYNKLCKIKNVNQEEEFFPAYRKE